jgi:L-2,4-diaminobutyric acid acetyltransferase
VVALEVSDDGRNGPAALEEFFLLSADAFALAAAHDVHPSIYLSTETCVCSCFSANFCKKLNLGLSCQLHTCRVNKQMQTQKALIVTLPSVKMSQPTDQDGYPLNQLVARCQPLDTNSVYCNLLQCTHFANTSIKAETDQGLVGFISGYCPPNQPDTLFVWQVAVDISARGQGLASHMLSALLHRLQPHGVRFVETTISPSNAASQALFTKVFNQLGVPCSTSTLFSHARHFAGQHEDEVLYRFGPIALL